MGEFGHHGDLDLPATRWVPPQPRDLPAWRREMVRSRWVNFAVRSMAGSIRAGKFSVVPSTPMSPEQWAEQLNNEEAARLQDAALYHVTEHAAQLSLSLADEMLGDPLTEDELPAPAGLVLFERPIGSYSDAGYTKVREQDGVLVTREAERVNIVAMSWGPYAGTGRGRRPLVWVTFYSPVDVEKLSRSFLADTGQDPPRPEDLREMRRKVSRSFGKLMWDDELVVRVGQDPAAYQNVHRWEWLCVARAAFMLMRSPGIIGEDQVTQSRADFKHEQRPLVPGMAVPAGREPVSVRVVDLRRAQTMGRMRETERAEGTTRIYSCRWIVAGHTRMQPYGPDRALRRRIYIEPHLQGPEGGHRPAVTPFDARLRQGPRPGPRAGEEGLRLALQGAAAGTISARGTAGRWRCGCPGDTAVSLGRVLHRAQVPLP